jgi:hypothetical protein
MALKDNLSKRIGENIASAFNDFFSKISLRITSIRDEVYEIFNTQHDAIGRILKCHLLIEIYLDKALKYYNNSQLDIDSIRLTFNNKVNLLANKMDEQETYFEGIKELNRIRNKIAHNLNVVITLNDVKAMKPYAEVYKQRKISDPIEVIERFSLIAAALIRNQLDQDFGDLSKLYSSLVKQLSSNAKEYQEFLSKENSSDI